LKVCYRTSRQIRNVADCLLAGAMRDEEERAGTISVFDGPAPAIVVLADPAEEIERVVRFLRSAVADGIDPGEIGLFVRSPEVIGRGPRGITIPVPCMLRWTPSLRRPDGSTAPAMVARIDGIDGELIGVSRTWLDRDAAGIWRRCARAMLGRAGMGHDVSRSQLLKLPC
jgi:hypothetical protein